MEDLKILNQLLNCNHLEPNELKRAKLLIERLKLEIESRN